MFQKIVLVGIGLMLAACTPRRDAVCTGNTLSMCEPSLYFSTGSTALRAESTQNLDWTIRKLNRWSDRTVMLTGHADLVGNRSFNRNLSLRRAKAVRKELIRRGVAPDRIAVRGFGQDLPVTTDPKQQQLNRRVDITFGHIPHEYHLTCN